MERLKANLLQHDAAIWIAKDLLVNSVTPRNIGVRQYEGGDTKLDGPIFEGAMAFLFREEIETIGDDEAHIARASLIDPWVIDLVENTVAGSEPDFAVPVQRRSSASLGAGCPARRDAWPSRRVYRLRIAHEISFPVFEDRIANDRTFTKESWAYDHFGIKTLRTSPIASGARRRNLRS